MPAHGLHSVRYLALLTWLIMFTARFDALPKSFRVACFRARRSTHAFRVLPNAVRRVQVLGLASCNALNTVRVYVVSLECLVNRWGATLPRFALQPVKRPASVAALQLLCHVAF